MGKMSRTKGHSFERWCSTQLRKVFPRARRKLENHRTDARAGVDILHTGRYKFQCKRFKKYARITAIFEVKICPIEGGCPVLITQGDRQPPMAVLPFDELLRLLKLEQNDLPPWWK